MNLKEELLQDARDNIHLIFLFPHFLNVLGHHSLNFLAESAPQFFF